MNDYVPITKLNIMIRQSCPLEHLVEMCGFPHHFMIQNRKTKEIQNYQPVLFSCSSNIVTLEPYDEKIALSIQQHPDTYLQKKLSVQAKSWLFVDGNSECIVFNKTHGDSSKDNSDEIYGLIIRYLKR